MLSSSQTYASLAAFRDYAALRGLALPADDERCEQLLIAAMDYLEVLTWKGVKTDPAQPLQWPRSGVYLDCSLIPDDLVPYPVVKAQMVLAFNAASFSLMPTKAAGATGQIIQETVPGAVSVTYATPKNESSPMPSLPEVRALLAGLVVGGFGGALSAPAVRT